MTAPRTVLLTGAAGGVGTLMRERLPQYGYELRLLDAAPVEGAPEAITADIRDTDALLAAVRGVDAIIHLAGISLEAPFEKILDSNIEGTYSIYEAARAEGVRRVVYASSNHAVGFTPRPADPAEKVGVGTAPRPDTYYGVSKVFGEALASLYADKYGVETVSIRIGSCFPEPRSVRMLDTWLSPDDCARLLHAALTAPDVGHTVVYGLSANTRAWWDMEPARALGYEPQDDSEVFAEKMIAEHGEPDHDSVDHRLLGGHFTTMEP
ncbi:NAD-dependent epimerase/dehydratase family protein [Wenjunlia tyrosinilytica]|uniref:NAD-dependent dehydratase n=1 Tax=Wenjunlia tyrosinilytica TaxID=1544741 RepID=A0A917ZFV0_9ACTN|nr:NAD(P)-dependent oxidoreductase [Wenjunlia tyrosinilytica]GGO81349.1 NAD-dependent dehydratase [Wenjunlia tyrosinilytica]